MGHSLIRSLICSHHSLVELALPRLLCSRAPLRSLVRLLAHFADSLARGTVNDRMAVYSVFFLFWPIVDRCQAWRWRLSSPAPLPPPPPLHPPLPLPPPPPLSLTPPLVGTASVLHRVFCGLRPSWDWVSKLKLLSPHVFESESDKRQRGDRWTEIKERQKNKQ